MFDTKKLLRFHSLFKSSGFAFFVIRPPVERNEFWTPAHDEISKIASDFIIALHNSGAIDQNSMDKTVVSADQSYQLRNDSGAMNSASLFEVAQVLTFLMGAERFTPGTITTAYNNGLLVRVLERVSVIEQNNEWFLLYTCIAGDNLNMMQRRNQVNIRLTDDELTTINDLSYELSLGRTQFIRFLVRQYANRYKLMSDAARNNR